MQRSKNIEPSARSDGTTLRRSAARRSGKTETATPWEVHSRSWICCVVDANTVDAVDAAYSKAMKDLGADENGTLLSDITKSIGLTATCVRVY